MSPVVQIASVLQVTSRESGRQREQKIALGAEAGPAMAAGSGPFGRSGNRREGMGREIPGVGYGAGTPSGRGETGSCWRISGLGGGRAAGAPSAGVTWGTFRGTSGDAPRERWEQRGCCRTGPASAVTSRRGGPFFCAPAGRSAPAGGPGFPARFPAGVICVGPTPLVRSVAGTRQGQHSGTAGPN